MNLLKLIFSLQSPAPVTLYY